MPLFNVPQRADKEADKKLIQKSKSAKKPSSTIKGGGGLLATIQRIKYAVEHNLGKYRNDYMIIREEHELHNYFVDCVDNGIIAIDTETTGLDPLTDKIVGLCIYTPNQPAAYVPINHTSYITDGRVENQLTEEQVADRLNKLLEYKPKIIMFNAKFDIRVIRNQLGVKDIYCTWDCFIAARLLNENEPTNKLKKLHQKYVLDNKEDEFAFDELFNGITFDKVPIDTGYLYAAHDAVVTYELYEFQKQYINLNHERKDYRDIAWVFNNIEMPCIPVICDMEDNGIKFDFEKHKELSEKYHKLLDEQSIKVYDVIEQYNDKIEQYKLKHIECKLDEPINLNSTSQIAILLYDILGIESVDNRSPRGTGADILAKIDNPICKELTKYKELSKLINAFIDSLPKYVNTNDGRIHCSFKQYGAATGRMSCTDPNLQQIPAKNKEIRQMFSASDNYVLMSSDFSAQEPRLMAELCGDKKMIDAYKNNRDLYAEIASFAFNVPYEDCLEFYPDGTTNKEGKARRSQAKALLLGILYGRGIKSVAEQLHTTLEKAQQIQDKIFKGFPAIPQFEKESLEMAKELGYVTTIYGSKRRLLDMQLPEYEFKWKDGSPKEVDLLDFDNDFEYEVPEQLINKYLNKLSNCRWNQKRQIFEEANRENIWIVDNGGKIADATRQCINARVQGSAAQLTKLAMININKDERLKELGFRLLVPIHDELLAECPEENVKECSERFVKLMIESGKDMQVPSKCDLSVTRCWYGVELDGKEHKRGEVNTARQFENELTRINT